MQSSKRILRSHEIPVPQSLLSPNQTQTNASGVGGGGNIGGTAGINIGGAGGGAGSGNVNQTNNTPFLETELDLHFSLQYPHFIKRDGNR